MDLFCFASRNLENIKRGVAAKKWAVATVSFSAMNGRMTKARRYFGPGAFGLLYCNPTHSFTVPFLVRSTADPNITVTGVWPEAWVLPFSMEPLGDHTKQLSKEEATRRWPLLQRRVALKGSVSGAMNLTGTTVFVPVHITEEDWELILRDLAS